MPKCNVTFEDVERRDRFVGALQKMGYRLTRWTAGQNFANGRILTGDGEQVHYEAKQEVLKLIYDDDNVGVKDTIVVYAGQHDANIAHDS